MKLKVGDKLICLINRPLCADVKKGEIVTITEVESGLDFTFSTERRGSWLGTFRAEFWKKYNVSLENK